MRRRPVIIDTDPGQDDAVALLLAFASPELEVLGVTTVAGNVPLERTTRNALSVRKLAEREDIPVFSGASAPLRRPLVTAEYVHGVTGLDGAVLPEPTRDVEDGTAVDFLVDAVMSSQEPVTLCTLGPLTNVAQALAHPAGIAGRLGGIVMMGGGFFEGGNVTPAAEFNVYVDPHAAATVLASGVPITMLPLDVTHRALASRSRVARFRALGTPVGEAVAGLLEFFDRYDSDKYGVDGAPLHDPCVVAYLLAPELFAGRACNVEVETSSELTMGMTVVDWWGVTGRPANTTYLRSVDDEAFFDLLVDRLGRLGG